MILKYCGFFQFLTGVDTLRGYQNEATDFILCVVPHFDNTGKMRFLMDSEPLQTRISFSISYRVCMVLKGLPRPFDEM